MIDRIFHHRLQDQIDDGVREYLFIDFKGKSKFVRVADLLDFEITTQLDELRRTVRHRD